MFITQELSQIMQPMWAVSIDAATCLRMELTLFALVLISYCLFARTGKVVKPLCSHNKSCKGPKSKNAMAMVAKCMKLSDDVYPHVNFERFGMRREVEPTANSTVPSDEELTSDGNYEAHVDPWKSIAQRVTRVLSTDIDSEDEDFFAQWDAQKEDEERCSLDSWCSLSRRLASSFADVEDDEERSSLDSWRYLSKRIATAFADAEDDEEGSSLDSWRSVSKRIATAFADAEGDEE